MNDREHSNAKGRWEWLVMPCEPDAEVPEYGRRNARGILIAIPLSALLWWGLIALWRAFG